MALRVLNDIGQFWQAWRRDHPEARTLPIVMPIVVYNGERPWTTSCGSESFSQRWGQSARSR